MRRLAEVRGAVLDGDEVEASDDPVHGGGMPVTDPEEARSELVDVAAFEPDLAMTGLAEDGAAMAVEEGSSVADDDLAARFELDGDPDVLDAEIVGVGDEQGAEDLDSLLDVSMRTHDPDDPKDPDGFGVPPGTGVPTRPPHRPAEPTRRQIDAMRARG